MAGGVISDPASPQYRSGYDRIFGGGKRDVPPLPPEPAVRPSELVEAVRALFYDGVAHRILRVFRRTVEYLPADAAPWRRPTGEAVTAADMLGMLDRRDPVADEFVDDVIGAAFRVLRVDAKREHAVGISEDDTDRLRRVLRRKLRSCRPDEVIWRSADGTPVTTKGAIERLYAHHPEAEEFLDDVVSAALQTLDLNTEDAIARDKRVEQLEEWLHAAGANLACALVDHQGSIHYNVRWLLGGLLQGLVTVLGPHEQFNTAPGSMVAEALGIYAKDDEVMKRLDAEQRTP